MLSFRKFAISAVCASVLYWTIKWWMAKEEPFFSTSSLANSKKEKRKALPETCADKEGHGVNNLILEDSPIGEAEESKKQSASTEANIKKEEEHTAKVRNLGISEAVTEVNTSVTAELTSNNKLANDYVIGVGIKSVEEDSFNTTENISLVTEKSEQTISKIEDNETEKTLSVNIIKIEVTTEEAKKSAEKLLSIYATTERTEIVRMADELKGSIYTLKITTEVRDSVEADLTPFDKLVKDDKKTTEDFAKSKYTSAVSAEDLEVTLLQQQNVKKEGQIFDKLEQEELHTKKKKKKKKFIQSGIYSRDLPGQELYNQDIRHHKMHGGVKGFENLDMVSCYANSAVQCLFSIYKNLFNVLPELRDPISNEIERLAFSSLEKMESTNQLRKLLPSRYGFADSVYQDMTEFWETVFDCVDNENIPNYANRLSYQSSLGEMFHYENRKYLICDICRWSEIDDIQISGKLLHLAVPESDERPILFNKVLNPIAVDRNCPNGHELTSHIVFTQTSPFLAVSLNRNLSGFRNNARIVNNDLDKINLEATKDNGAIDSCYHDLLLSSVKYKAVAIAVHLGS